MAFLIFLRKKQLSRIPEKTRIKVFHAASELKSFPDCTNANPLKNHDHGYRLRVAAIVCCSIVTEKSGHIHTRGKKKN